MVVRLPYACGIDRIVVGAENIRLKTNADPLSDDDYSWLMHQAMHNGPDFPKERERFRTLCERLDALTPDSQGQERTAYHEAAHAVVARRFGYEVPYVLIRDDHSGEVPWTEAANFAPTPQEALDSLLNFATVKAAGKMAEEIKWRYARAPEKNLLGQVILRLRDLYRLSEPMSPDARKALLSFAAGRSLIEAGLAVITQGETRAAAVLRANWIAVQNLADTVLANRRVDGTSLTLILAGVKSDGASKSLYRCTAARDAPRLDRSG